MKKILLTLSSLVLLVTVFAFAANASTKTRLTVNVPFAFTLGETAVTAGEYFVEVVRNSSGGATIGLTDTRGKRVALILGRIETSTGPRTVVEFKKSGDERV